MSYSSSRLGYLVKLIIILSLICAFFTFAGFFTDHFSLFTHFICYSLIFSTFTWIISLTPIIGRSSWRPRGWKLSTFFAVLAQAAIVLSTWFPVAEVQLESPQKLSVLWMNLSYQTKAAAELELLAKQKNADIVALAETYSQPLSNHFAAYPYSFKVAQSALWIFSKYPILNAKTHELIDDRSLLMADIAVNRRRVRIITGHLRWPIYDNHRTSLNTIAELGSAFPNVIIAGDFNSSHWASPFRNMLHESGLKHSRQGRGVFNSWHLDKEKLLGLPIDHILYRGKINCTKFDLLKTQSSDHNAIYGEYLIGGKFVRKSRS
ncbi:MAG: endonuclease/exonuclease/phosphatase family protein [Planctomycetota bacterium]|jgi:endonuclease/exonuclease/phosphatase (EEP) superfamily protein YafD|nr:endonuclease/exonuclease/phosphatase family protein [Planctomycetota bacterium]